MNIQARIKGALRQVAKYAPEVQQCLQNAIHPTEKGVRGGNLFICNKCGLCFKRNEVQVDHIEPVVPTNTRTEDMDWNTIIKRMFCELENYQVLCKPCHQIKCNRETEERGNNEIQHF